MTAADLADLLRTEIAYFARDPGWVRQVSAAIADAVHAELGLDREIRARTRETAASVVVLFAGMVEREESPEQLRTPYEAVDYVREFVMRGVPLDIMVRAYQ